MLMHFALAASAAMLLLGAPVHAQAGPEAADLALPSAEVTPHEAYVRF